MIRIDQLRARCNGCNACAELAPERWRMSRKDGKSTLVGGEENKGIFTALVHDDEFEQAKLAEQHCALRVIRIFKL